MGSLDSSTYILEYFQIGMKNQEGPTVLPLTEEKAVALVKDVFISAAERDIYTGDALMINVLKSDGIKQETFNLRRD